MHPHVVLPAQPSPPGQHLQMMGLLKDAPETGCREVLEELSGRCDIDLHDISPGSAPFSSVVNVLLHAAGSQLPCSPCPCFCQTGWGCCSLCSLLPSLEEQRVWVVLRQSTGCLFGFLGYYTACSNNHIFLVLVGPSAAERKCGMAEVKHQPGNSWGHQPQPLCATLGPCYFGCPAQKEVTKTRDEATSSFNNSPRAPITPSRELGTQAPAMNCSRNYRNENVCAGRSQAGCEWGCEREPGAWVRLHL